MGFEKIELLSVSNIRTSLNRLNLVMVVWFLLRPCERRYIQSFVLIRNTEYSLYSVYTEYIASKSNFYFREILILT